MFLSGLAFILYVTGIRCPAVARTSTEASEENGPEALLMTKSRCLHRDVCGISFNSLHSLALFPRFFMHFFLIPFPTNYSIDDMRPALYQVPNRIGFLV